MPARRSEVGTLVANITAAGSNFGASSAKELLTAATCLTYVLHCEAESEALAPSAGSLPAPPPAPRLAPAVGPVARACAAIYCSSDSALARALKPDFAAGDVAWAALRVTALRPAHAILVSAKLRAVVVALRGTSAVSDLAADAAGHAAPAAGGAAHAGIATCAEAFFAPDYGAAVLAHRAAESALPVNA